MGVEIDYMGVTTISFSNLNVMKELHNTVTRAWNTSSLWDASIVCFQHSYYMGRVAEYLLYYAFVPENYPKRKIPSMKSGVDIMDSGVCNEEEMKCCSKKHVLLNRCHDHRIEKYRSSGWTGDMCCESSSSA